MAVKPASRAIKQFGTEVPDAKRRILTAGPITAMLDNGALRYIRFHGVEVLRGIAYLLRDKNWGTYGPVIAGLKVKQGRDGFTVSYSATAADKDQAIAYCASITASASGTLTFTVDATPTSDFLTNRTGFVVLHPLDGVVGQPVEIVHSNGKTEKTRFPKVISPGQPVFEIRSLTHTVMPGVRATVLMEGNKFEMEDHRNWMDASFKTYVCSLLDPWPYTLKKGQAFNQTISVRIDGKPAGKSATSRAAPTVVEVGGGKGRMPMVGTAIAMCDAMMALAHSDLIAAARPARLVCQIDGRMDKQTEAAEAFRTLRDRVRAPVTLEIILPAREKAAVELHGIADRIRDSGLAPDAVVITQMHDLKSFQPNTPRPWGPTYEEMAAAARAEFPGVTLGGGMLSFFTELNRKRTPKGLFDFVTHSVCPIVHAADDLSVMETLESLPSIIASAKAIIGKAPYHWGPSSIPCRDNPYGAAVASNPENGRVCLADMDPRQRGLYAASWYVGLAAAAARGGLDAIALGSAVGPQGVIYQKAGYAQPWFDGSDAKVFPAYHVLAGLAAGSGARRIEAVSSSHSRIAALAHQGTGEQVLWLANLTGEAQQVKVKGLKGAARLHMIDEAGFAASTRKPDLLKTAGSSVRKVGSLELGPYAVARIATA